MYINKNHAKATFSTKVPCPLVQITNVSTKHDLQKNLLFIIMLFVTYLNLKLSIIMDKLGCSIFILCIFTTFLFTVGDGDQQNLEGHKRILSFPERLRSMFSFPKTTSTSYWEKVKTLINQARAYFFPPNIE